MTSYEVDSELFYGSDAINALAGRTVRALRKTADGRFLVFEVDAEDGGRDEMIFEAEGDCCASAYVESVDAPEVLRDACVTRVEVRQAHVRGSVADGDVLDAYFYAIHSERGTATIELRVDHNGYYSGWLARRPSAPAPFGSDLCREGAS